MSYFDNFCAIILYKMRIEYYDILSYNDVKYKNKEINMNYSRILSNLIRTAFKGIQYKKMPVLCRIVMIICMAPVILFDFVLIAIYHILNFFYKGFSTPVEILHNFLCNERKNVRHGTEAVLYFVAFPFIWFSQICLASMSYMFYILWFLIMTATYIWTLGGIKWQPFLTEATPYDINNYVALPRGKAVRTLFSIVTAALLFIPVFFIITSNVSIPVSNMMQTASQYDVLTFHTLVYTMRMLIILVCLLAHYACIFIVNPIIFKIAKVSNEETADAAEDNTTTHSETINTENIEIKEQHKNKHDFQITTEVKVEAKDLTKCETKDSTKLEAEEHDKHEAEERVKRAIREAEERAKQTGEVSLVARLTYAVQIPTDDGMIRYLNNIQDEAVQNIINEHPEHLIREHIKQLLDDL